MSDRERAPHGEIVLYQAPDGTVALDVRLERDSLWLSQKQMAELFDKDVRTINEHIRNVFGEGELERGATIRKFRIVRREGEREVAREIEHYDLDVIISVGYRVKSQRGVRFRQWATGVLRQHVLQGYTVNEARLRDLHQAVRLISDTAKRRDLSGDEAKALLAVVGEYSRALELLDDYDHQCVKKPKGSGAATVALGHEEALRIVDHLRSEFGASEVFGVEKDQGLESALGAVVQTFGGKDVYPSLEEKAAHLLYFVSFRQACSTAKKARDSDATSASAGVSRSSTTALSRRRPLRAPRVPGRPRSSTASNQRVLRRPPEHISEAR